MVASTINRGSVRLSQGCCGHFILIIDNDDLWLLWLLRYFDNGVIIIRSLWFFQHLDDGIIAFLWLLHPFRHLWGYLLFFSTGLGPSSSGLIVSTVCQQEPSYRPRLYNFTLGDRDIGPYHSDQFPYAEKYSI